MSSESEALSPVSDAGGDGPLSDPEDVLPDELGSEDDLFGDAGDEEHAKSVDILSVGLALFC
jgi:hypothetical protein